MARGGARRPREGEARLSSAITLTPRPPLPARKDPSGEGGSALPSPGASTSGSGEGAGGGGARKARGGGGAGVGVRRAALQVAERCAVEAEVGGVEIVRADCAVFEMADTVRAARVQLV